MIPVVERKGEINMGTITGCNLTDVKKQDTIYKYVDKDSAWFSRPITGREYDNPRPKGILALACRNMHTVDKYFCLIILEDLKMDKESPDFDSLDLAIEWMQVQLAEIIKDRGLPENLPKWIDIPADCVPYCYNCHHFVGYRENRDGGKGQGQYYSCRDGRAPLACCEHYQEKKL